MDPKFLLENRLRDIQAYSYSLASFTLQWKELEELFESIQSSVDDCFKDVRLRQDGVLSSSAPPQTQLTLNYICLNMDGKGLASFLTQKVKEGRSSSIEDEVSAALSSAPDPAVLVLDAVYGFYPQKSRYKAKPKWYDLVDTRMACIFLLEQLMKISAPINPAVTEKAKNLAVEWKPKTHDGPDKSLRALGLLFLLAAYELSCVLKVKELFNLLRVVALNHRAPELYRRLGPIERVSEFIQKLIANEQRIEAIKFIYEFGLVDKFPAFPLLRDHLQYVKRMNKKAASETDSFQSKGQAIDREIAAIQAVMACVEDHKIKCKYTSKSLGKRISQLRFLKRSREGDTGLIMTGLAPQAKQPQHHNENKKLRPNPAANNCPR